LDPWIFSIGEAKFLATKIKMAGFLKKVTKE